MADAATGCGPGGSIGKEKSKKNGGGGIRGE